MTTVGLKPLMATDFHSSEGWRSCSHTSETFKDCLQTGQVYGACPANPWLFAHGKHMAWLRRGSVFVFICCEVAIHSANDSPTHRNHCPPCELGAAFLDITVQILFHRASGGPSGEVRQVHFANLEQVRRKGDGIDEHGVNGEF